MNYKRVVDKIGIEFEGFYTKTAREILQPFRERNMVSFQHDGSLEYDGIDSIYYRAMEIVTAPLGAKALDAMLTLYDDLLHQNYYVLNDSCGLHFHISLKNYGLGAVCNKHFYTAFLKMMKSRHKAVYMDRSNRHYCRTRLRTDDTSHFRLQSSNRYSAINFSKEDSEKYGRVATLEVRLYGGEYATIEGLRGCIQDTIDLLAVYYRKHQAIASHVIDHEVLSDVHQVFNYEIQQLKVQRVYATIEKQQGMNDHKEYVFKQKTQPLSVREFTF